MPDSRPLDTNQKIVVMGFPALGGIMLALGLYLMFIKDSQSPLVFGALGISMILFLIASVAIGSRLFGPTRSARQPATPETSPAEAKDAARQVVKSPLVPTVENTLVTNSAKVPAPEANPELTKLMNTTLGEILLAAHLSNPEGAGSIVAQAVAQVGKNAVVQLPTSDLKPDAALH